MDKMISMLHLWRCVSPAFPIGAYAYSQGLENAVDQQWVYDERSAYDWLLSILSHSISHLDIPVLNRLHTAWQNNDIEKLDYWNRFLLASRESKELLCEDQHLGSAFAREFNNSLTDTQKHSLNNIENPGYACMLTLYANHWKIPVFETGCAYAWTWCENQVAAAIKLIPLGQSAGQRMLAKLIDHIPELIKFAQTIDDEDIGGTLPGLGMCSALHETQYTRLFRS